MDVAISPDRWTGWDPDIALIGVVRRASGDLASLAPTDSASPASHFPRSLPAGRLTLSMTRLKSVSGDSTRPPGLHCPGAKRPRHRPGQQRGQPLHPRPAAWAETTQSTLGPESAKQNCGFLAHGVRKRR